MPESHFVQLLQQFAARAGVSEIELDGSGYHNVSFDGVEIQMLEEPTPDRVSLFCALGFVTAEDNREYVFEKLLAANLYWAGTAGATMSFDPENKVVMIAYRIDVGPMDVERFHTVLGDFTVACDDWTVRLAELKREGLDALASGNEIPAEAGSFRV